MNQIVTGFKGPNVLHIMGFIQFRISAWQRIELRNSGMKGRAWAFPGQPYALGLSIFTWAFHFHLGFPGRFEKKANYETTNIHDPQVRGTKIYFNEFLSNCLAFSRSKFVYLPHCRQLCHIDPWPRSIHLHRLHASESKLRILVTSNAGAWRTAQSLRSAPTMRCNRSSARRRTAQALIGTNFQQTKRTNMF